VTGRVGVNTDIVEPGGSRTLSPAGALLGRTATVGAERFVPSTSAEVTAGPSFDIGILDTQEFYQGILRAVDPDVVASFINMGWRPDLITALFVERVELRVATGSRQSALERTLRPDPERGERPEVTWVLSNDPHDAEESAAFGQFLQCFGLRPAVERSKATPLWPVDKLDKLRLGDLALLDGQKLALGEARPDSERMVERPGTTGRTVGLLAMREPGAEACAFQFVRDDDPRVKERLSIDMYHKAAPAERARLEEGLAQEGPAGVPGVVVEITRPGQQSASGGGERVPATIHIILRNAQAVIYYLGEYARADLIGPTPPYRLPDGDAVIDIKRGRVAGAFATARLDGETYSLANDMEGRSLSTIALVQQILNLQKSARDKPTTTSVRVVD
jgi:hypothetical protein